MTYIEFIQNIIAKRGQWNDEIRKSHCERHHIVPKCFGGLPKKLTWKHHDNVIWLTPKEHYQAHKLLAEENPTEQSLLNAWCAMAFPRNNKYMHISADEYETLRIKWSKQLKGVSRSDELKEKLHNNSLINPNYGMKGKKHSNETKKKIAEHMSGDKNPAKRVEVRNKISQSAINRGIDNSSWMPKIIAAAKNPEVIERKRNARLGKKLYTNGLEKHLYKEGEQPIGYYLYRKKKGMIK